MQYIDQNTTPRDETSKDKNDPHYTRERMTNHNRYATHNHKLKGFRVRLDFAEKDFIELDQ